MKPNSTHIDKILSSIILDRRGKFVYPEFLLTLHELKLANKDWTDIDEIKRVISKLKSENLELNYENLVKEYYSDKGSTLYEFSIPVEYPIYNSIKLANVDILLESDRLVEKVEQIKTANNDSRFKSVVIEALLENRERLFTIPVYSNNYYEARSIFENTHSLLRGLCEYAYSTWHWNESNSFFYPRFFLEVGNGFKNIQTPAIYTSSCSKPRNEEGHLEELNTLLVYFTSKPSSKSMYGFLSDVFRLYGLGKDANSSREKYLMYWNVLEKLLEPLSPTGNTRLILKRAELFQFSGFKQYKNLLQQLGVIRNNLVHRGIDSVEDVYVGYLKIILHTIIDFIVYNLKIIDTPEKLETFLLFSTIPHSDMRNNLSLIQQVLNRH